MSNPYRFVYERVAKNVSRGIGRAVSVEDVERLLDDAQSAGSAFVDEQIKAEAAEYGVGS